MTPTSFFRVIDGKLVLWNYRQHTQYEIDIPHLERIIEISSGSPITESELDQKLASTGLFAQDESKNWGWDCLSRIFHIGTQIGLEDGMLLPTDNGTAAYEGYINYCNSIIDKVPNLHIELPGQTIDLPPPSNEVFNKTYLFDALLERKTCRAFDSKSISLELVSTALWATFGAVHGESRSDLEALGLTPVGFRRTSPSGGSMHPSEAYLVSMRIDGLPAGIYHYRSNKHQLSVIQEGFDSKTLGPLLCSQNFSNDLSYGIFITSRFDKMWWKYPHSRAYRVALLDIGCLAQTFQLVTTAQNVQSWPTGYFIDHEINQLLKVDVDQESVMFFLGAGYGNGSVAREVISLIQSQTSGLPL